MIAFQKFAVNQYTISVLAWLLLLCGLLLAAEVFWLLRAWRGDSYVNDIRLLENTAGLLGERLSEQRRRLDKFGELLQVEPQKRKIWFNGLLTDALDSTQGDAYGFALAGQPEPPQEAVEFVRDASQKDILILGGHYPPQYAIGTRPQGATGNWLFASFPFEPLQRMLRPLSPSGRQLRIRAPASGWIIDARDLHDRQREIAPPSAPLGSRPIPHSTWIVELAAPLPTNGGPRPAYRALAIGLLLILTTLLLVLIFRVRSLIRSHHALRGEASDLVESLDLARTQLLQSESLASLGGQVAGVAHEVNTPIGIGLTAATHLQDEVHAIERRLANRQIRKSELTAFLRATREAAEIMVSNMQRAGDLIQSFKRVAIDQTNEGKRRFDLKTYLEEVLLSLKPRLRKVAHQIHLKCDQDIPLYSFPGALSQIITNLTTNALTHAYGPGQTGIITITGTLEGDLVLLRFADDGRGIPQEHIDKVFEPFFTTAEDRGGSGLGLHVVYNLITRKLGGEIRCDSRPGNGTVFTMRIPVDSDKTI